MLFDEDYTGQRWTYGLTYRPAGYAQVPDGYIIHSDKPNKAFRYGTLDYGRKLTDREVKGFELTLIKKDGTP